MAVGKVLSFERGAEFYFDLSFKHQQNGSLKSALRYIEKAVRIKPDDSLIQFSYAGLLAELGYIDLSSEVLLNIINNLDPDYEECYFGLGCNYLQIQKIKKSAYYFEKYLKIAPFGEFVEEAENILEMLNLIKEANNNLDDEELEKVYKIEEEGIKALERREYEKALKAFEEVVKKLPNALPAKNNLSLSYFYLGEVEKAIKMAMEVIKFQPLNIHANCNLCIYYNNLGIKNLAERQIRIIRKLKADNEEYAYKVADTLGCLNKHKEAYHAYRRLLSFNGQNPQYIHYTAIAAYNCKKYMEALALWDRLEALDNDNFLSDFYRKVVENIKGGHTKHVFLPYNYQLPKEEISARIKKIYYFVSLPAEDCKALLKNDTDIFRLLYFALIFDKYILKKLIFNKIKTDNLYELESLIRKYILRADIDKSIKLESIFLLSRLGAKEPYKVFLDGSIEEVTIEAESLLRDEWKKEWDKVRDKAFIMMKNCYNTPYKKIVEDIWYDFIKSSYPEVPKIGKVEVWAAALEYAYCKFSCKDITQKNLSDKYGVSKSSVSEKFRIIYGVIGNKFWKPS